ncbi:hypothetical protein [Actinoplanes sp. NPDC051411]|uniref:DUF6197 family protein n=1 Tax=Actinoplanes sp. NPDC051411 TaxID=3155522 RepID=UPI00342AC859
MHRTQNPTGPAADTDDTTPVVTPADIMRGAALYLEIHGWHQRDYYATTSEPFPAADVAGAIGMAAHGGFHDVPSIAGPHVRDYIVAYAYLTTYLLDQGEIAPRDDDPLSNVNQWNDDPSQTVEKVTATLRSAADEYDWQHASEDDLETYGENELDYDRVPTREGFLAWLAARR